MAPKRSETPTILAPRAAASLAANEPTLPKPWMITGQAVEVDAALLGVGLEHEHDAEAGGGLAAGLAADRDGLAGDDAG